jgi:hypothetical protein
MFRAPRFILLAACGVSLAMAQVRIDANFENGSAGSVTEVSPLHFRVGVKGQSDQDGRNRQANWYSFVVSGVPKGKTVILDLVDLPGEYNYQANRGAVTADTPPYWFENRKTGWQPVPGDYDPNEPKWRLRVTPRKGRFQIAHLPPYTSRQLNTLRKAVKPQVERIGQSVDGRPLELWTFDLAANNPAAPVVWLMFRQHAWEAGTSYVAEGLLRYLPAGIVWKVLPWCDPDGVAAGGVRFNRHGFDLNRNWDAPNDALKRPEILAQKSALEAWLQAGKRIDLFLTLHNTETGEYLEGPPASPLGEQLWQHLQERTQFDPDRPYFSRMDVPAPGRANVIQWLWNTHKVPAFLMELRIAHSKKLNRRPGPAVWSEFGAQLATEISQLLLKAKP